MTKDEKYLVELYRRLQDDLEGSYDPLLLAKELKFSDRLVQNILRGLMQANFVKYTSSKKISLTDRGCELAQSLSP